MPAAQIEFLKDDGRRYRALLQRPDGVSVAFDGGAYNRVGGQARELPHNIADPDPAPSGGRSGSGGRPTA